MTIGQIIQNTIATSERLGCVAYEAYRATSNGKSLVSGVEIPAWGGLPEHVKHAWRVAAAAVAAEAGK